MYALLMKIVLLFFRRCETSELGAKNVQRPF